LGIEPATFQLLAQCLNQLRTACPYIYIYIYMLSIHELFGEQFALFEQRFPVSDLSGPLAIPHVGAPRDVKNYVNGFL